MAYKTLILGDSGTGKSASLRNFNPEEITVINCAEKPLPFRNSFETISPKYYKLTDEILKAMVDFMASDKKVLVIDDAQYIMSFQYMRRIKENGWDKWNDIQGDFFEIIRFCDDMPEDRTVYFLSHIARDEGGREKIKTMGKMLDEKITIEGLFTTVLKTSVQDGHYYFVTQNSGMDTVKSPMGLFDTYAIDNDLAFVDAAIRAYYGVGGDNAPSESEVKAMSEQVARPEVEKPEPEEKGSRRRKARRKPASEPVTAEPVNTAALDVPAEAETPETVGVEEPEEKPKRKTRRRKTETN